MQFEIIVDIFVRETAENGGEPYRDPQRGHHHGRDSRTAENDKER